VCACGEDRATEVASCAVGDGSACVFGFFSYFLFWKCVQDQSLTELLAQKAKFNRLREAITRKVEADGFRTDFGGVAKKPSAAAVQLEGVPDAVEFADSRCDESLFQVPWAVRGWASGDGEGAVQGLAPARATLGKQ
jgi:hypothetical protein